MGGIAAVILLLSMIDTIFGGHGHGNAYGHQQWSPHVSYNQLPSSQIPPGHSYREHSHNHYQYYSQLQQQRENAFIQASLQTAEWVCRNPRTGDMMIISSETINSQNIPNGHRQPQQHSSHEHRSSNYPPKNTETVTEPINSNQHPTPDSDAENHKTNFPNAKQNPQANPNNNPPYHGGEGMIDIRIGKN